MCQHIIGDLAASRATARTPAMRLTHPTIRPVGRAITFQFDGSPISALEGETIAAALSAAGIVAFRRTAERRAARSALRHGRVLRLRGDRRWPHRPARLHDQGGRWHDWSPATRPCRSRPLGREPDSAAGRGPGLRRAGGRRRSGRAVRRHRRSRGWRLGRCAGRTQRHRAASTPSRWPTATPMRRPMLNSASAPSCATARWPPAPASRPKPSSGAALRPTRSPPWSRGRAVTFRPRRLILAPGAHERPVPLAGLDAAGRDDHWLAANAGSRATRLPRRARADRRQRPAQSAACLRTAGLWGEAGRRGGSRAAPGPRRVAPGVDHGARRARPACATASACC